jgi:hypothetical protein
MAIPQLDNLVRIGKLKIEPPERAEFDGLVRSGSARLKDARNERLAAESRFDLAYNAAHALTLAALRVLDRAHAKRNAAEYSGEMEIDAELLAALLRVGRELEEHVLGLKPPEGSRKSK